jgi:hypothetical protein
LKILFKKLKVQNMEILGRYSKTPLKFEM